MGNTFGIFRNNLFFKAFNFIGELASTLGPLGAFERNTRLADETLLKEENFTNVPSVDVLKNARQAYNQQFHFDEGILKEVRIFRYLTYELDKSSNKIKGKLF